MGFSQFLHILSQPAWQGVGTLIALIALILAVWFERSKHSKKSNKSARQIIPIEDSPATTNTSKRDQNVIYFAIVDPKREQQYYDELAEQISNAKETIYRLGRGFYHENRTPFFDQIIRAEERALQRGVHITRIQVDSPVASSWAQGYANLLSRYAGRFRIVVSLNPISLNDICLIDPQSHNPVVNFLFETKEPERLGEVGRPVTAMFIMNAHNLAKTLSEELARQANKLPDLTPDEVKDLAQTYVYFGWGVHMSSTKMSRDVPGAHRLGKARLRKWRRNIVGILSGPADRATIRRTGNDEDSFDGVAYELSWWGKARLDRLEKRAYREVAVEIEVQGVIKKAFTYVPLPRATARDLSPGSWIDDVIDGALENNITDLLTELGAAGLPIDESRRNIL